MSMNCRTLFGINVRALLAVKGLSQEALAEATTCMASADQEACASSPAQLHR
jgi:hypothetical protein